MFHKHLSSSFLRHILIAVYVILLYPGGGTVIPEAGVISGGICTGLSFLSTRPLLELQVMVYDLIYIIMILLIFGQTGMGKQCRPRSNLSCRNSQVRVYSVCYSFGRFWTH